MITAAVRKAVTLARGRLRSMLQPAPPDPALLTAIEAEDTAILNGSRP
mgnify:CR=1 FL=1